MAMATTRILARRLGLLFLLLVAAIIYGVAGYMLLEGWSLLDALYMTVITLTTVGFREIRILDTTGRLFTISLLTIGVGFVLISISLVAGWIAEGDLGLAARRRRMKRRIDAMSEHFIVCAYGRVGRAVAREFEAEDVPFVVIDPKESLEERMQEDGVVYLIEDPSEEGVLREAGVERARGLVCAVDSDATNVYIALMARSISSGLFIVARASERGSDDRLRRAGADRVVSPFVSSGRHMALVAMNPLVADVLEVESPGVRSLKLEEVTVDDGSPLDGRMIADVLPKTPALAIRHADGSVTVHPARDQRLAAGDLVLLLGEQEILANRGTDS
jgi:voltage-gated potassium channel